MGTSIFALIFLLLPFIVQVLQKTAEKRQAADQKKKQLEAIERQKAAAAGAPLARPAPSRPGEVTTAGGPAADLAARRKAQLEELRQRRAGKSKTASKTTVSSAPTMPAPATRPGPVIGPDLGRDPSPGHAHTVGDDARLTAARQKEEAARQAMEQQAARETARHERQRQAAEAARAAREKQRADALRTIVESTTRRSRTEESRKSGSVRRMPSAAAAPADAGAGVGVGRRVRQSIQDRQRLRELIVLREILDAPISLRTPSSDS